MQIHDERKVGCIYGLNQCKRVASEGRRLIRFLTTGATGNGRKELDHSALENDSWPVAEFFLLLNSAIFQFVLGFFLVL